MDKQLSSLKINRYKKLFHFLRKRKSSKDDHEILKIHENIFEKTDCLSCGNCCKTHSPLFIEKDILRIAKHLKLKPNEFVNQYLIIDEDGDFIFNMTPCPFLLPDNYCSIYGVRPRACQEYPHTNRKKIYQIETLTLKNAEICPAVEKILDQIIIKIQTL